MREIMVKAHKLTREMKEEFPEVDYKFQLGLCLKELMAERNQEQELTLEEKLDKALEEKANKVGANPVWNKWEKGQHSRMYYSYTYYIKGRRHDVKCGYLDLKNNEYVTYDRYYNCLDLLA